MKAIIGTGQLGLAILDELLKRDPQQEILLVNRSGKLRQALPANVQLMAADATDKHKMALIAREAEVIYSCTDVPYQDWSMFYPAAANAMAHALVKTNARLVFADNMYSYGNVHGAVMNETLPHSARTKKGKIRASVIDALLHSGQPFSQRVAIVKAADFVGPGIHKGMLSTDLLRRLYEGKAISLFGDPSLPHTFTYISDFARAMVNIGDAPDTSGQVWHVANAPAISARQWIAKFEQASGRKAKLVHMPKVLVWIVGRFSKLIGELYELAYQFEYPYLVDDSKYTARFGSAFTGHNEIVAASLRWFEANRQQ